jgi:hypothetical protein
LADQIIVDIKQYFYEEKTRLINKFNKLILDKYLQASAVRVGYKELYQMITIVDKLLLNMRSLAMDAYALARMLNQQGTLQGKEVVVYTGAYHINIYANFFKQFVTFNIEHDYVKDKRCINIPTLPQFLDVQLYRDYANK